MTKYRPAEKSQSGRFVRTMLPGILIVLVGFLVLFTILVYKVSYPGVSTEAVTPSQYILPHEDVLIPVKDGKTISAWWVPGQKGAPGIILATGYGMSRADALSMAVSLNQKSFNLLIFDQRGSGVNPRGISSLGLKETSDMADTVRFLKERPDSNPDRIGIWGVDASAFAALKTAGDFPEVQAIVADSPFLTVSDFLNYRLAEDFGISSKIIQFVCNKVFSLFYAFGSPSKDYTLPVRSLADKSILFIKGGTRAGMEALADAVYEAVEPRKEMYAIVDRVHTMSGEILREYDLQVTTFFQLNLPTDMQPEFSINSQNQ